MITRRSAIVFVLLAVVTVLLYQSQIPPAGASDHRGALLVYPGAKEVWSGKRRATDRLSYHVHEKFPASSLISWISAKLEKQHWEPLTYDFLDPSNVSSASQLRGWHPLIDATGSTEQCVQQWLGDWKDSSGNVVRYVFRYKCPKGCAPNSDDLEVLAVYVPAPFAKQAAETFERFKRNQERERGK